MAGVYKIFPEPQISYLKNYIAPSLTLFNEEDQEVSKSVLVYNSLLQRLLIKKNKIPGSTDHGGGLSVSGHILFVVTNKGTVLPYDLNNYNILDNNIISVPMNLEELYGSGHPDGDFRIDWFRVNGAYSEYLEDDSYALFVSHNGYLHEKDCITHNISRTELEQSNNTITQIGEWETIFTASPCIDPVPDKYAAAKPYPGHISGGPMINYNDNQLLVSIGDYNRHGLGGAEKWAMDTSNPHGKTILVDKRTGDWSVFTTGHRNISGLYQDKDSAIWSVENGPKGGDELNILSQENNYGWPEVSYGLWYDHSFELLGEYTAGTHPGYEIPFFSWVPSVAPRGLVKIEGDKFNFWKDDLIMGTMRDKSIRRLRLDEKNRVTIDERIEIGHRMRDLITLPDHKLAAITDDDFLIIIDDGGAAFKEMDSDTKRRIEELEEFEQFFGKTDTQSNQNPVKSGRLIFEESCSSCHNLTPRNAIGPHLHDLLNRKVGSNENYSYSQTLEADKRMWNSKNLRSFLQEPNLEFEGTTMQEMGLSPNEVDSLIQFFESL